MQVATNLPLYALACRLFGRDAALWTLLAFNSALWFITSPDGLILPDTPLLLMLATGAWAVGEILFAPEITGGRASWLWLTAGVAFGLAGLSKYSAAFTGLGLITFLVSSPERRRRLHDWRPYAAAALALALVSPVLVWNAEHNWISFAFQSGRALARAGQDLAPALFLQTLVAEVVFLSPWIAAPAALGARQALRRTDERAAAGFLLCLAAPPLVLFALLPLIGERSIPHWFDSGWLFLFPFAGAWFAGREAASARRWAAACIGLAAASLVLYVVVLTTGIAPWLPVRAPRLYDPTALSFDWPSPVETSAWRQGREAPGFVMVGSWRVGGRVGAALGPEFPVCGFGDDPRGLAFACDPAALVGRDALIVATEGTAANLIARAKPWFDEIGPSETVDMGRLGRPERRLILAHASRLKAPYPLPYGLSRR